MTRRQEEEAADDDQQSSLRKKTETTVLDEERHTHTHTHTHADFHTHRRRHTHAHTHTHTLVSAYRVRGGNFKSQILSMSILERYPWRMRAERWKVDDKEWELKKKILGALIQNKQTTTMKSTARHGTFFWTLWNKMGEFWRNNNRGRKRG